MYSGRGGVFLMNGYVSYSRVGAFSFLHPLETAEHNFLRDKTREGVAGLSGAADICRRKTLSTRSSRARRLLQNRLSSVLVN